MNIMEEARSVLEGAGYRTEISETSAEQFVFEDHCILGFVTVLRTVTDILKQWESDQDSVLKQHALSLRKVPDKLWNIYSVFLTAEKCPSCHTAALFQVEEDFRATRKIARAGIAEREDVRQALLALLPIQSKVAMRTEDVKQRLMQRLTSVNKTFSGFLEEGADDIAGRLMEKDE